MNSLYKNKIKITVLITSIKQRKITIETANYYSQICTEVVLVDEQKPCLSTLDIIALKKKNITYIPYKAVNSKKMITQAYQKRLIAAHESNNRYVVHSNHDERYTYFGLLACMSELKKNKKLNIKKMGKIVSETWNLKKNFSKLVTNNSINRIYNEIINKLSYGGKLLGAGNGGFILIMFDLKKKKKIIKSLKKYQYINVDLEKKGTIIL